MRIGLQAYIQRSVEAIELYKKAFGATLGSLPWSSCCANVVDKFGVFWYISV